jgi:hypothetical protein
VPGTLAPEQSPSAAPVVVGALPEQSLAIREVLGFPAALFCGLPLHTVLRCSLRHDGRRLVVASSTGTPPSNEDVQAPAFVGSEWDAMVLAAERERGTYLTVAQWCERKLAEPKWRLTRLAAIDGAQVGMAPLHWSIGRVLHALGLELVEVLA